MDQMFDRPTNWSLLRVVFQSGVAHGMYSLSSCDTLDTLALRMRRVQPPTHLPLLFSSIPRIKPMLSVVVLIHTPSEAQPKAQDVSRKAASSSTCSGKKPFNVQEFEDMLKHGPSS